MQERTIFIGGSERSGTTVLHAMLCSSPDTHVHTNECQYLITQLSVFKSWYNDTNRYETFLQDFVGDKSNFKAYTKSIVEQFLTLCRQNLKPGKHLVIKSPTLIPFFPTLADLLPDALFIINVRDPRDTIASMLDVAKRQKDMGIENSPQFHMGRDIEKLARYFLDFYTVVFDNTMEPYRDRTLYLRYEDFILNNRQVVSEISKFCDIAIPDEATQKEWNTLWDPVKTKNNSIMAPWQTELNGKKLSDSQIGRFKHKLTPDEIALIDQLCRDFYHRFHYTFYQPESLHVKKSHNASTC